MITSIFRQYLSPIFPIQAKRFLGKIYNLCKAKQLKASQNRAIKKYGKFGADELEVVLNDLGVPEGCVLFFQNSWNHLHTFSGGSIELIGTLLKVIGDKGTLLMPAYTNNSLETPPRLFDVCNEPTYTGLVNEIFRRSPGVFRSLHPRHSICGIGPNAKNLLAGHERSIRADGPNSPFDHLRKRSDSFFLTIGLPKGFLSFLHWVEDFEPEKLPFQIHEDQHVNCWVQSYSGEEFEVSDWLLKPKIAASLSLKRVFKHISSDSMRFQSYKGIKFGFYPAKKLAEELIFLRNKGIIHYK